MIGELEALVAVESLSADDAATQSAARLVDDLFLQHLGSRGTWLADGDRGHLMWSGGGETCVLLVGHVDTVWPFGTTARWPFAVVDGRASGPRVRHESRPRTGHPRPAGARRPDRRLVPDEDGCGGRLADVAHPDRADRGRCTCGSRAGAVGGRCVEVEPQGRLYELVVHGRAAHAGLEPEKDINAAVELAHQVL